MQQYDVAYWIDLHKTLDTPIHGEDASHYSLTYDLPKVVSAKETQDGIVGHIIVNYDGQPVGRVDMKAEPIESGFSVTSWLVGTITSLLGW